MSCLNEGLFEQGKERDTPEHDFGHCGSYWGIYNYQATTSPFFSDSRALASDQADYLITLDQVPQPCWANSFDIDLMSLVESMHEAGEFLWEVLRSRRIGEGNEESTDSTRCSPFNGNRC